MNIALVLAGGTGSRVGMDVPKQYIELQGEPIINYCLKTFGRHGEIDKVQIVADEMWQEYIRKKMEPVVHGKFCGFSAPGENRQLSILNGLRDIRKNAAEEDLVMVHDAARPLLSQTLITSSFRAIMGHDGVLPVLPMKDTVYYSQDGTHITSLLNRSSIFAGQAPETFVLGKYLHANEALLPRRILEINGSTEPAMLAELDIVMIPGEERNFKITTREDLQRFEQIMRDTR